MTPHEVDSNIFEWHLLDAGKQPLGRLATRAASLLLAKHRTDSERNAVAPVYVVIINTDSLKVTGKKRQQKMYRRYTGYPGGLRERNMEEQLKLDSRAIVRDAVSGMMPKNSLRTKRLLHLKLYPASTHPHMAQISKSDL